MPAGGDQIVGRSIPEIDFIVLYAFGPLSTAKSAALDVFVVNNRPITVGNLQYNFGSMESMESAYRIFKESSAVLMKASWESFFQLI